MSFPGRKKIASPLQLSPKWSNRIGLYCGFILAPPPASLAYAYTRSLTYANSCVAVTQSRRAWSNTSPRSALHMMLVNMPLPSSSSDFSDEAFDTTARASAIDTP